MASVHRKLEAYIAPSRKCPFEEWLDGLRDKIAKARILSRLDRLRVGNFGDCKSVGSGVYELRIHFGPGYRVYFGLAGAQIVLLLLGGDKRSQSSDIAMAQTFWKDYSHGKASKEI